MLRLTIYQTEVTIRTRKQMARQLWPRNRPTICAASPKCHYLPRRRGAGIPAVRRAHPRRRKIQKQGASQPSKKRLAVQPIIGGGDLWITEFILTYDGKPSYTVSIMEFRDDKVARETQYFADPFVAPAWRAQWVERMDT